MNALHAPSDEAVHCWVDGPDMDDPNGPAHWFVRHPSGATMKGTEPTFPAATFAMALAIAGLLPARTGLRPPQYETPGPDASALEGTETP